MLLTLIGLTLIHKKIHTSNVRQMTGYTTTGKSTLCADLLVLMIPYLRLQWLANPHFGVFIQTKHLAATIAAAAKASISD